MHNSFVRHAESESVAIQFSHGLLEFRKRMPSCRQTIIPVELRNPRVRSVAERAGHGTTPTVRGAWDRTMDTIEGTWRFVRAVARDGARDPRPPPYEVQRMGCIVISGARTTVMIIDWRYDIPGWAGAPCYVARPAAPGSRWIRSNVAWSGAPLKYLRRASVNSGCRASTAANSVMQEWNFIASTCPKICSAVEPSTALTSRVHSTSRDPSTGCARYAAASFTCGWRRSALSHSPPIRRSRGTQTTTIGWLSVRRAARLVCNRSSPPER